MLVGLTREEPILRSQLSGFADAIDEFTVAKLGLAG